MPKTKSYKELVDEAFSVEFSGWDFSFLEGRLTESSLPWDYLDIARAHFRGVMSMLDMGTGGGEILSTLAPLPPLTFASEGYGPNLAVAEKRLRNLGVEVVQTFCDENYRRPQRGEMPFRDSCFDLVLNRHESFKASEVCRVLKKHCFFITQQTTNHLKSEFNEFLGAPLREEAWSPDLATVQIEDSGLKVRTLVKSSLTTQFANVGAVVSYLRMVPWQIDDFSIEKYGGRLRDMHDLIQEKGGFLATDTYFCIIAVKE